MTPKPFFTVICVALAAALIASLAIRTRFERDLALAAARAAQGSVVVTTRCGPNEVQQAGVGGRCRPALLVLDSMKHSCAFDGRSRIK